MILRVNDVNIHTHKVPKVRKKVLSSHEMSLRKKTYWQEMKEITFALGDKDGNFSGVKNAWKDKPCFIIGASAAIKGFDFNLLNGLNTIGINHLIEDWDLMKWFIYIDEQFLHRTTYDLRNFKGKVFARNSTSIIALNDYIRFKNCAYNEFSLNLENGLIGCMSGVSAVHLAIISGANPIYMLGLDTPIELKDKKQAKHHYKDNYPSENINIQKYLDKEKWYKKFEPYKERIINVCENGTMTNMFKRISQEQLKLDIKTIKGEVIKQEPVICHVLPFRRMDKMNEVTRQIFNQSYGEHIKVCVHDLIPKADIYLLECILRGKEKFIEFKVPSGKLISLVHSANVQSKYSDRVVVLTESQKANNTVIPCAIDMKYYNYDIDYTNKNFGRITPFSPGKVHPKFDDVVNNIKTKIPDSRCQLISYNVPDDKKNSNITYIEDIDRGNNERKAFELSKLSIFADMHNTYKETFSISLLEGMASGLAIVLYSVIDQPAMIEVIGDTGIICKTKEEFEEKIIWLLENPDIKKEYGLKAKERAKLYSVENMITKWDKLFKEVLNEK